MEISCSREGALSAPVVSVIVPTHGRPRLLAEAIESVLAQSVRDIECVVVDDASPTPVEVARDPRVRLVRRPRNGGPGASRNTGIRAARGRAVAFLDDDDLYTPERVALGLAGLERAPVAICLLASLGGAGAPSNRALAGDVSDTILDALTPNVGQATVERSRCQLFDETFRAVEDVEWWLRMAAVAHFHTVDEVGYLFRHHDGPRHLNDRPARVAHRLRLLDKHAAYFAEHPRAAAFQLRRAGLTALGAGDRRAARRLLARALRLHPEPRTLAHLLRSLP